MSMPPKKPTSRDWMGADLSSTHDDDEDEILFAGKNVPFAEVDQAIFNPNQLKQDLRQKIANLEGELEEYKKAFQQGAVISVGNGARQLGRFTLTRNSLVAPDNVTMDELTVMAEFIRDVNGSLQFWGGDLANIYINVYGVQAEPTVWLAEFFGVALKTLQEWANVCRIFPISARAENLNFSHHREVYYVPEELQNNRLAILQYASENALVVRDLQAYIKSLLPPKQLPKGGLDTLLSKERAPNLGNLRKLMSSARSGDKKAQTALRKEIDSYRAWLKELAESAGIE